MTDIRADLTFLVLSSQSVLHGPFGSLNTAPQETLQVMVQLVRPCAVQVAACAADANAYNANRDTPITMDFMIIPQIANGWRH